MRVAVIAAGRIRERDLLAYEAEMKKRITAFARVEDIPVSDDPREILQRCRERRGAVHPLDLRGRELSSREFADLLDTADVSFVIGPAEGFGDGLYGELCGLGSPISLSRLTLPHRLCKTLLWEQIYRGFCIRKGLPYAK